MFWGGPAPQIRVDLFIAKLDFEREVLATARAGVIFGREVRVAGPEAMLIYKLVANRPKDALDVETIFEARRLAGERLDWSRLERWAGEWGISERLEAWARYRDLTA